MCSQQQSHPLISNGRSYKGRVTSFGSLCFGLDGTIDKHHPSWLAGIWLGKDIADHDFLAVGDQKLIRCKAVRQTDKMWDKEKLAGLKISPADLLKLATHSKVKLLPAIAPVPVPIRDEGEGPADEAASDPPSPTTVQGDGDVGDAQDVSHPGKDDTVLDDSPNIFSDEDLSQSQPSKRTLEGATGSMEKSARMETRAKHAAEETKEKDVTKHPRLELPESRSVPPSKSGLQSSPMHASNIRRVSTYGGVDIYIEDEDGCPTEPYLEGLVLWMESLGDDAFEDEKRGPPDVDESMLQSLDQEAAMEEVERLRMMNVIEDYHQQTGEELILDTRQVYDWRYRDGQWRRRCRLVAREFRAGAQSTEETFAPTSSKYVVNIYLAYFVFGVSVVHSGV